MALVGSLSGSIGTIAVTGSLIPGSATFDLGSTSSKWRNVYASNITGSLQKTGAGDNFVVGGPNITANYNSLGQWEITASTGGGGAGVFTESGATAAFTTSSIAIGFGAAASTKGSDVFFAVSGSNTSSNTALFSGPIVTSGSFAVKDLANGNTVASISGLGVISGSALQALGNLTVQGNAIVSGSTFLGDSTSDTTTVAGSLTVGGTTITATAPTTINLGNTAATVNVGQSGTGNTLNVRGALDVDSTADIAGNITLSGNAQTVTHSGTGNLTISSTGGSVVVEGTTFAGNDTTVAGDLTVSGNDIVFAAAAGNIATAATSLNVGGASTTTLTLGGAASKVVVAGDLEVQGTTMTVSASNLVIEDPLVGFGFLSGSVATSAGDRGFIGGITGAGNNVAFGWSNSNSAFVATRTTSTPEDVTITVSALQPIRASKLEVNGTSAYVTSSNGTALTVFATDAATVQSNNGSVTLNGATGKGTSFEIAGVQFAELKDSSTNVQFGAAAGKALVVSGTTVTLDTSNATNFTRSGSRVGQLIGTSGTEFKIAAMDAAGGATSLVLTGSSIDLSANTLGVNLKFNDTGRGTISYASNTLQVGTLTGVALALSGTNGITLTHGASGATFVKDTGAPAYLVVEGDGSDARLRAAADLVLRADGNDIKFNNATQTVLTLTTAGNSANFQGASNQQVNIGAVGSGGMTVSGSTVTANVGTGGFVFQRDGVAELLINAVTNTTTISGSADQNVILAAGTGVTTLTLSGSTVNNQATIAHRFNLDGALISHVTASGGRQGFFPGADSQFDLGGPSIRWANIYTGDLHLRNERGSYTLIEESDFLSIRFNKNGKRYKFLLERVPELDEK